MKEHEMLYFYFFALSAFGENFGEGRQAIETRWWLVIPVFIGIVAFIIYWNVKAKKK